MNKSESTAYLWIATGLSLLLTACGGSGKIPVDPIPTWTLTVNSSNPASGASISVSPADRSGATKASTSFTLTYAAGAEVNLTAPSSFISSAGGSTFVSWSGCTAASTVTCTVTMNANETVTANYKTTPITSISVTPNPANATIGGSVQFAAAVAGVGTFDNTVTWSLLGPPGSALSSGTITSGGLYTTPYPAPATVTVVATSNQDQTSTGSVTVTLNPPAIATGPALTVDTASPTHAISPYIYGMNAYQLDPVVAKATYLPIDRWGGDSTTSYSYLTDTSNTAGDYYFENFPGTAKNYPTGSEFNTQLASDAANGTKTLGTVPLIGWTPLRNTACSFSVAKYGVQKATDPSRPDCGNGVLLNGNNVVNDPTDAYSPIDNTFTSGWVKFLASKFGTAANGGVAIYDLDNEPEWWDTVHIDIHPKPFNYDELTAKALQYAHAIKANDPTAQVSGPVISYWMDFFYSKQDIETGWSSGPCYCANGNPTDRVAHGDIPLIEYYLQQFKKSEDSTGLRLLNYLDLHTYFAADNLASSTAGDTATQKARLNSTRVFWDSTYTDPNYTDPNNRTNSAKPYPPQLIPLMHRWIAANYPGTKTAITEYNWGGQEHINGALAQADILGIFGREGLDLGTLWGPPDPQTQVPGEMAFEVYRNYDGAGSEFGDMALPSVSGDQGKLSVYGALRTSDNEVTIVVLNKTYGDLNGTLSLKNLQANGNARTFLYSSANLAAIVAQPDVTITPPATGGSTSTLTRIFPAQSITLFVIPKM
jgi:hypothetical protein